MKHNKQDVQGYRDLWVRLIVSLPSAHFILAVNEPENFMELIKLPGYPLLLVQNYVIIFLLISLIRSITIFLNRSYPWVRHPKSRIVLQIIFGAVGPSLFTLALVGLYFRYHGLNIFETSYMKLEWWFAIVYILTVNGYYLLYHMISDLLTSPRS